MNEEMKMTQEREGLIPVSYTHLVGETFDGTLNNINGFKVTPEDVLAALDSAAGGPVQEGCVGGGTGMRCHGFKGGTGTASRIVETELGEYTLGVLVQANHGTREELNIRGVPVGREIVGYEQDIRKMSPKEGDGSIIVVDVYKRQHNGGKTR